MYEKVLSAPSEQLQDVRDRDDWNLTHYLYMDKANRAGADSDGSRRWSCSLQEAAAGKTFYPAKATVPKVEPATSLSGAPAAPGSGSSGARLRQPQRLLRQRRQRKK